MPSYVDPPQQKRGGSAPTARPRRVVGYLRVSTSTQDLEKFKAAILAYANEKGLVPVIWVEEKVTSKKDWKQRELGRVFEELEPGDVILSPELSRLGRSMLDVMEILAHATRNKIKVHDVKGGRVLNGDDLTSKIYSAAFALAAEIEKELISRRTTEALAARKAQGVKLGRKPGIGKSKLDPHKAEILADLTRGVPVSVVAKRYGSSTPNLRHWLKRRNITWEVKP